MKTWRTQASAAARRTWFALHRGQFVDFRRWRRPRVFVDVSVIVRHDAKTGIQRVVRAIWFELSRRRHPVYDFVPVYAGANHGYCIANHKPLERQGTFLGVPVAARAGDKFLGLDLTAHYLPDCREQLETWRAAGASVHTVIYDLLPLTRPDWFNLATRHHFERWFATVVDVSDQLLCISEDVATGVRRRLHNHPAVPRLGRLQLSGDIPGSSPSAGLTEKGQKVLADLADKPLILMVGTVEPRKGYHAALDALEHLWRADEEGSPNLVIVGKPGWKTDDVQARIGTHAFAGRKLFWLDAVSDEELAMFYEAASFVLVASRAEGFGLPLSEAALHRRWVLARDLAVFREQMLPNVRFFSSDEPAPLAADIRDMLALAARSQAPAVILPDWATSLDRLLEEIDVEAVQEVPQPAPRQLSKAAR